jgi:uncharacterized protein YwgA
MNRLQTNSLLLALVEQLRADGSWTGETHMQKATYFLQHLMDVRFGFDFILYKHGPFSFDLRDELTAMRAQGFLRLEPQYPYGPTLIVEEKSELLRNAFRTVVEGYLPKIRFVSEKLASKSVTQLERTATALYVTLEGQATTTTERVKRLTHLKPHISWEDAQAAISEVDGIILEANLKGAYLKSTA